jgi:DNA-binding transcriptional ArsR family regulator
MERGETAALQVVPSAALELMWVLHNAEAHHALEGRFAPVEPVRVELGATLRSFWRDRVRGFAEVVVLAQRAGSLRDRDLGGFFAGIEKAAISDAPTPSLLSETPAERTAIGRRLDILRRDAKVRSGYVDLVKKVWGAVRVEWEEIGQPAVAGAARDWQKQLDDGAGYRDLVGRTLLWPGRPDLDELADAAAAEGRLVLSPGWFFGDIHLVELDGGMYVGRGIQSRDDDAERRHVAKYASATLKAFADPTRLAILLWLAREPASVTEIARHFKLSQPTVSAHVQLLRETGVLEERAAGRSSMLSANEETVRRVFNQVEEQLADQIRHQRTKR